jgi:hypothetical protein
MRIARVSRFAASPHPRIDPSASALDRSELALGADDASVVLYGPTANPGAVMSPTSVRRVEVVCASPRGAAQDAELRCGMRPGAIGPFHAACLHMPHTLDQQPVDAVHDPIPWARTESLPPAARTLYGAATRLTSGRTLRVAIPTSIQHG